MKYQLNGRNFLEHYGELLLRQRGVGDCEKFLNPTPDCLQDWRDLSDILPSIDLVIKALTLDDPQIGIIVDPDCDGYTSAAILYQYLLRLRANLHIRHYLHTGKQHGLSDLVDTILQEDDKLNLLIIPDGGTNDDEDIDRLLAEQIAVLVIDHHLRDKPGAPHCLNVNPQLSPNYKNKALSGAGVVYQFCRGLDDALGHSYANDYVDLAALGVCGDMMDGLEIENQYLWHQGFSHIKNSFFQAICTKQAFSMKDEINPTSVAFYVAPLINAMVRMGTMEEKEHMFLAFVNGSEMVESHKRGANGALERRDVETVRECTNVKSRQDRLKEQMMEKLALKAQKHNLFDNKILFIRLDDDDDFPAEMNGLIAAALVSKYNMPTIVARLGEDGYIKGSIRGVNDSPLPSFKNFLEESGFFQYVSGHDQAAGCSILNSNLDRFHAYANEQLKATDFGEKIYYVDFERKPADNDLDKLIYELDGYKFCWSQHNPTPLIAVTDIYVRAEDIQIIGRNSDTIKFEKNGITYIKFLAKSTIAYLEQFTGVLKLTVVGKAAINEFRGYTTPQIQIEDLDVEQVDLSF